MGECLIDFDVPKGWSVVPADKYCITVADGTHDSPKQVEEGEYLVTSKHITGGNLDLSSAYKISYEDYKKINERSRVDIWDVLITMIGTVGDSYVVSEKPNYAIKNIGLFKCGEEIKAKWLNYFLQSSIGKDQIEARMTGSTQSYVTLGELRNLPILVPPKLEQEQIVKVLSSLDDKIDLLHRQNKTLESMAEVIFREWFIEGVEGVYGKLSDVVDLVYGESMKENNRSGQGYPVIGSSGIVGYHKDFLVTGPGIVIGRKGTLGKVHYIFENFFPIDTTFYISSKIKSKELYYEYFLLKECKLEDLNSDSAVPGLNRNAALDKEVMLHDKKKIMEFEDISRPIFSKLLENINQIKLIKKMQNGLFVKLLNGEVAIEN